MEKNKMIPIIQQAIFMGYTAHQILNFLGKKLPQMTSGISDARGRGYKDEDILKFLQGKIKVDNKGAQESKSHMESYLSSSGLKTKQEKQQDKARFIKGALGVAGTALGAYGAYKNYSNLFNTGTKTLGGEVLPAIPEKALQLGSGLIKQQQEQPASDDVPIPPMEDVLLNASNFVKKALNGINMDQLSAPQRNRVVYASKKLQELEKEGAKTSDHRVKKILEFLEKSLSGTGFTSVEVEQERFGEEYGTPEENQTIEGIREDEKIDEIPEEGQKIEGIKEVEIPEEDENIKEEVETKKIAITPSNDFGTIESIENGVVTLDIDGKKKRYREEDIIETESDPTELADTYERLISQMEEASGQPVSRNVYYAAYDDDHKELVYIPHSGRTYIYDEISPEDAKALTDLMTQRKTSGENYIGAWEEGTQSPIGAAISQLILKLQKERGGKGKEYMRRYEMVYDALEPAKKAKKEKYEKEKAKNKKPRKARTKKPK